MTHLPGHEEGPATPSSPEGSGPGATLGRTRADFDDLLRRVLESGSVEGSLRRVHNPCRRLVLFRDFYHDVLVRTLERWHSFHGRSEGELVNWIKIIAQRLMIDLLRRSKHRQIYPLPPQVADVDAIKPIEASALVEEASWLRRAMDQLDDLEREILNLRYFEKHNWSFISGKLSIKENTIIKKHLRLISKLRALRSGGETSTAHAVRDSKYSRH